MRIVFSHIAILTLCALTQAACTQATRKNDAAELNLKHELKELVAAHKSLTGRLQMIAERMALVEDRLAVQEATPRKMLPELPVVRLAPEVNPNEGHNPQPEVAAAITQADVSTVNAVLPIPPQIPQPTPRQRDFQKAQVKKSTTSPQRTIESADPRKTLSKGTQLVNARDYDGAVVLMREFRNEHGASQLVEFSFLIEGRAYFESGNIKEAIGIYRHLVERFPNGAAVPDALYMIGLSQERLGQESRAVETLARLKTIYPATEAGKRAAAALAERSQSL